MALSLRSTLICDDIRREDNGKLLFVGVYTPGIRFAQLPASISLCAFQVWEAEASGIHQFRLLLKHVETGRILLDGQATMEVPRAGAGYLTLRLGALRFEAVGDYQLLFMLDGVDRPVGEHQFGVTMGAQGIDHANLGSPR
jgi:hypothetical protein